MAALWIIFFSLVMVNIAAPADGTPRIRVSPNKSKKYSADSSTADSAIARCFSDLTPCSKLMPLFSEIPALQNRYPTSSWYRCECTNKLNKCFQKVPFFWLSNAKPKYRKITGGKCFRPQECPFCSEPWYEVVEAPLYEEVSIST